MGKTNLPGSTCLSYDLSFVYIVCLYNYHIQGILFVREIFTLCLEEALLSFTTIRLYTDARAHYT